jgi:hypothetical protein
MSLRALPIISSVVMVILTGCRIGSGPSDSPAARRGSQASPTPSFPSVASGPASSRCLNGWITPAPDSALYERPISIIREALGIEDRLVIVDMRFFQGPESPPGDKGYLKGIKRWYVKGYVRAAPSFRARFLVEEREFGPGLSAVAPFDTSGFRSPDWTGFQYEASDRALRAYPGLPGKWTGTPYDVVRGGAGLTLPGLPRTLRGCLDGA